ncbi:MAG: hypothetical protein DRR08_24715 [Candidatus Parabeggiatoa sp. nov. 2]|nr:MAG: hypothetical protein B6247_29630 [Beggiatoa sp. 4572_84]RKZ55295.1 MAG: hypothetical protein DRR08_24715 [Gammaproteobacteria bacterium]HEC84493.1 response regulator transcription factor [Thioploca sp.]
MRILWIDDDYDEQKEQDWFGNIREQHEVQSVTDFEDAYQTISNQLEQYDLIVIDINLYKEGGENELVEPLAKQFGISPKEYLEEGGFHLYLKLLAQGFDTDRIVFLTGNVDTKDDTADMIREMTTAMTTGDNDRYTVLYKALRTKMLPEQQQTFDYLVIKVAKKTQISEFLAQWHQEREASAGKVAEEAEEIETVIKNSQLDDDKQEKMLAFLKECKQPVEPLGNDIHNIYNRFEKRFREARLIPPKAIKKSPVEVANELQKWLRQFCERRDGNKLLYEYLTLRRGILNLVRDMADSRIQITNDFHDLDKNTFLNGIVWLLRDFSLPETKYNDVYFALCDYLSKPYERFGRELDKDEERHFKLPLVRLRNWISHGLIEGSQTHFSAQEACFTFLIAMKSMFNQEMYGQHNELKRLYPQESPRHQDILENLVGMYQHQYRHQYANPLEVIHWKTQKDNNPKKENGEKYQYWKDENYLMHFYAAYLFSATRQINPHDRSGTEQKYPRRVTSDKFNPFIQVCYYHELKDTPFNGIAIQQLRQQLDYEQARRKFDCERRHNLLAKGRDTKPIN